MRVLVIDKTAGLKASHERHQAMARQDGVELHVLGPRYWIESERRIDWQPEELIAYQPHFGAMFFKDYYARAGYFRGLCRALWKAQPDVIQLLEEPWSISALQASLTAAVFAPQARILFYTWENIYRSWMYPSRASALYRIIDRFLHARSRAAVCATAGAEEVLRKKGYDQPTRVIPYGIPNFFLENTSKNEGREGRFTLGYLGRFLHMKGIDLLLRAAVELPDIDLILAGSGDDQPAFQRMADEWKIGDRVQWCPPISEEQVPRFFAGLDGFVLPSRRIEGWQEQLGRVAIEAMAAGVPVIGARSGAIPETLGGAGLLFEENSVDSLVKQIRFLREHPVAQERLRQAGRQRVLQRFTWDRFAEEICTFYRTLP